MIPVEASRLMNAKVILHLAMAASTIQQIKNGLLPQERSVRIREEREVN
jgi:hypothetical protein